MAAVPPRPDAERLAAWRAFLQAHALVTDVLARELEDAGQVPLPWYDVLLVLTEAGGRLRMQELASRLVLSRSGITRLVDRLQDAGYVGREHCSEDRRGTWAVLTAEGRAALRRAAPVHLRGIEEHFTRHLSDGDAATLRDALTRILDALGRPPA